MRVDKFLTTMGVATRSEASKAAKRGLILVNGKPVGKSDVHIDPDSDKVTYCGREIVYKKYVYVLLNKPDGYVSATEDNKDPTVLDLMPEELRKMGLFVCGRLDKHTLGLMLLTNNGDLAHRLLSPTKHVEKQYFFRSKFRVSREDAERFEGGLVLEDGYETKPAKIELCDDGASGYITLTEGKYHQIKRMLEALDNKITYLERVSFGPFKLDEKIPERGNYRVLEGDEVTLIENYR